jgi:hypothetical protein
MRIHPLEPAAREDPVIRRLFAVAAALAAALGVYAAPASATTPPPFISVWCTALPHTYDGVSYQLIGTVTEGTQYYKFWQGNYATFPFGYAASLTATCTGDSQSVGGASLTPLPAGTSALVCTQHANFTDPAPPHYSYTYAGQGPGNILGHDWYQYWRIRGVGTDLGSWNAVYHCGAAG